MWLTGLLFALRLPKHYSNLSTLSIIQRSISPSFKTESNMNLYTLSGKLLPKLYRNLITLKFTTQILKWNAFASLSSALQSHILYSQMHNSSSITQPSICHPYKNQIHSSSSNRNNRKKENIEGSTPYTNHWDLFSLVPICPQL